ncbi:MAG: winged helix-turn-helix transcriptional regulator [Micrococcales bacterium]|nr:winged helix-turn-helix transcriptional regulator [Micrococcales bacterium]
MADIFDVVADPTRRDLLERLRALTLDPSGRAEISVGQLVAATGISQPTVSKHLKTLRDHGLVEVREAGQHRYYRLNPEPLDRIRDWVAVFAPTAAPAPDAAAEELRRRTEWAGAELGDRVGRLAAETAHGARFAWERLPVVGRR